MPDEITNLRWHFEVGNRHAENLISEELIERITFLCSLQ